MYILIQNCIISAYLIFHYSKVHTIIFKNINGVQITCNLRKSMSQIRNCSFFQNLYKNNKLKV